MDTPGVTATQTRRHRPALRPGSGATSVAAQHSPFPWTQPATGRLVSTASYEPTEYVTSISIDPAVMQTVPVSGPALTCRA
ncbi:MAG TPA: hypothetical protein VEH55_05500 [Gaiellaceae bacterium]|nr:hypothetical protein [Gaiellaceae bacterium]